MTSPARRGRSLEDLFKHAHRWYMDHEKVWIHYNRAGGWFRGAWVPSLDKASPDFYCVDGGRLIAFDVKQVKQATRRSWMLDARFVHQADRLRSLDRAGALCFFAVEQHKAGKLYLLRVYEHSPPRPSVEFVPPEDADVLRIGRNDLGWYDWLPAVREWWI